MHNRPNEDTKKTASDCHSTSEHTKKRHDHSPLITTDSHTTTDPHSQSGPAAFIVRSIAFSEGNGTNWMPSSERISSLALEQLPVRCTCGAATSLTSSLLAKPAPPRDSRWFIEITHSDGACEIGNPHQQHVRDGASKHLSLPAAAAGRSWVASPKYSAPLADKEAVSRATFAESTKQECVTNRGGTIRQKRSGFVDKSPVCHSNEGKHLRVIHAIRFGSDIHPLSAPASTCQ